MEEQVSPLAVTHILQHTLRSLCIHENSQWVYAVFWRILPRNYPPPKDSHGQGGAYDRSRVNRRNWILAWEDGFCNFTARTVESVYANCEYQHYQGVQPELFFKMSHEIYNYGEGLIGKIAADHSHKWIYNESNDDHQEMNLLSEWHNSADSHPRTWEAQFQSGIKTIALIAVREGLVQLGSVHKVIEDLSYIVLLRKKFSYIGSIPGVLLPHPSSASSSSSHPSFKMDYNNAAEAWHFHGDEINDHFNQPMRITHSMTSLEALLSKLPSVVSAPPLLPVSTNSEVQSLHSSTNKQPMMDLMGMEKVAKEEIYEKE